MIYNTFDVVLKRDDKYLYTKPYSCYFKGQKIECLNWRQLYINLFKKIYLLHKKSLRKMINRSIIGEKAVDFSNRPLNQFYEKIDDGFFLRVLNNVPGHIDKIGALLDLCGINHNDLIIKCYYSSEPPTKVIFKKNESSYKYLEKSEERKTNNFFYRWLPKFYLRMNSIFLVHPSHKIDKKYNYKELIIEVTNNNKILYRKNPLKIVDRDDYYEIIEEEIELADMPLGNICYRIVANNITIYDSGDQLFRKFIVFNTDGKEIISNTKYVGQVVICCEKSIGLGNNFIEYDKYKMVSRSIKYGDFIEIDNTIFNFTPLMEITLEGEKLEDYYLNQEYSDEKIPVFRNVREIKFECDNRIKDIFININGNEMILNDLDYKKEERSGINRYNVYVDDITNSNLYRIEIYNKIKGKKNNIGIKNILVDINCDIQNKEENGEIFTSLVSDFKEISGKIINYDSFSEKDLSIVLNNKKYFFHIPLDIIFFRINGGSWSKISEGLWIGDIKPDTELDIYGKNVDEIIIVDEKRINIHKVQLLNKKSYKQISVGFLKSFQNGHKYLDIILIKNKKEELGHIRCFNQFELERWKTKIRFNQKKKCLEIIPVFNINAKASIELKYKDKILYRGNGIINKNRIEIYKKDFCLESFKDYNINFIDKSRGLFKEINLGTLPAIFCDYNDMVGKKFKIINAIDGNNKKVEIQNTYLNINKQLSFKSFEGSIVVIINKKEIELDNINPVNIKTFEVVNREPKGNAFEKYIRVEIISDKDGYGDGLLYDEKNKSIKDSLDDDYASDLLFYKLSLLDVKDLKY